MPCPKGIKVISDKNSYFLLPVGQWLSELKSLRTPASACLPSPTRILLNHWILGLPPGFLIPQVSSGT